MSGFSCKFSNNLCFFWQTDTASVLQEASGYIKFLHQQLEVCSMSPAHRIKFVRSPFLLTPMHRVITGSQLPLHASSSSGRRCA
jgi:hypothetical protein